MTKKSLTEQIPETDHSILTKAFGDKYIAWTNIKANKIALTEEEKKQLADLIEDRDHYEIKRTIAKLREKEPLL